MKNKYEDLGLSPRDIVVIPDDFPLPEDFPNKVIRLKGLYRPSLVSEKGYHMYNFQSQNVKKPSFGSRLIRSILGATNLEKGPKNVSDLRLENILESISFITPVNTKTIEYVNQDPIEPFFRHLRISDFAGNLNAKGGLTVYVEVADDRKSFRFSAAVCSVKDVFSRSRGRDISKGRFESNIVYHVENYIPELPILENISIAVKKFLQVENYDGKIVPTLTAFASKRDTEIFNGIRQIIDWKY